MVYCRWHVAGVKWGNIGEYNLCVKLARRCDSITTCWSVQHDWKR